MLDRTPVRVDGLTRSYGRRRGALDLSSASTARRSTDLLQPGVLVGMCVFCTVAALLVFWRRDATPS